TAAIGPSGALASVTVTNGGSGYAGPLSVQLSGGAAPTRKATASVKPQDIVGGAVNNGTVVDPGTGYTSPPWVPILGGGGTSAPATGQMGPSGSVTVVTVPNGGSGYAAPLTVQFAAPPPRATASVKPEDIVGGVIMKVTVAEPGIGYTSAP